MSNAKLTARQEQLVRQAFMNSASGIKGGASIAALEAAIQTGRADLVAKVLGVSPAAFGGLAEAIDTAFKAGAAATALEIGKIEVPNLGKVQFRFDAGDKKAADYLSTHSSKLISEISSDQLVVIQTALSYGASIGANPKATALSIVGRIDPASKLRKGGMIGLTSNQAQWMINAADELRSGSAGYLSRALRDKRFDSVIKKFIDAGEAVPESTITAAINSMQNRALKMRGDTIGRTESINALRSGQNAAVNQAMDLGDVEERDVTKIWDATGDSRTREDHLAMDGQEVSINEPFTAPDGSMLMFAGDDSLGAPADQTINCRCVTNYQIDFIGKSARIEGF